MLNETYNPNDDSAFVAQKPIGYFMSTADARSTGYDKDKFIRRPFVSVEEVESYFDTDEKRQGWFEVLVNSTGVLNESTGIIEGGRVDAYWWPTNDRSNGKLILKDNGQREITIYYDDLEADKKTYINPELASNSFTLNFKGIGLLEIGVHYLPLADPERGFELIGGLVFGEDDLIVLTAVFASPRENEYSELVNDIQANQNAIQAETARAIEVENTKANSADIQSNVKITFSDLVANKYTNIIFAGQTVDIIYKNPTTTVYDDVVFDSSGVATMPVTAVSGFEATLIGVAGVLANYLTVEMGTQLIEDKTQTLRDSLPISILSSNNFQSNANGLSVFNAGVITYDAVGKRAVVTVSSGSRGAFIFDDLVVGKTYRLKLNITAGTTPVRLYSNFQHNPVLANPLPDGASEYTFVMPPADASYGTKITLAAVGSGNFYVNSYELSEINIASEIATKSDVAVVNAAVGVTNGRVTNLENNAIEKQIAANDFAVNTTGITAFNGGTFVRNATTNMLDVTASSAGRGVFLTTDLVVGGKYELRIKVVTDTVVRIYDRWANQIAALATGEHVVEFTMGASGSFGTKVIVASDEAGLFSIDNYEIVQYNTELPIVYKSTLSDDIRALNILPDTPKVINDFTANTVGIVAFNSGTFVRDAENNRLAVTGTAGLRGVHIGASSGDFVEDQTYVLKFNVIVGSGAVRFYTQYAENLKLITVSGTYYFTWTIPANTTGFGHRPILCTNTGADTFWIDDVELIELKGWAKYSNTALLTVLQNGISPLTSGFVKIGSGAVAREDAGVEGIAIGKNSLADMTRSTAIGDEAKATHDTIYDPNASNSGENLALGSHAKALSWRAVAVGPYSIVGSTSATNVGFGNFNAKTHATTLGRGCYLPNDPVIEGAVVLLGGGGCKDFGLNNWWGHKYKAPPTGISIGNVVPSTHKVRMHGQDAYDEQTVPDDFNVAGGDIAVSGGRGTGIAPGGKVQFETAPVSGTKGQNEKNDLVVAGYFDAEVGVDTRFLLLDVATDTYKRVKIAPVDGDGRRMLYIN